jgi:hypothetical protein
MMNTQQTMHTLNAALFEYEENYFNCRNAQVVAYLRSKGVPVDYYFYNTLENTKTVYDHLFTKNQNRWLFETVRRPNCRSKVSQVPFGKGADRSTAEGGDVDFFLAVQLLYSASGALSEI